VLARSDDLDRLVCDDEAGCGRRLRQIDVVESVPPAAGGIGYAPSDILDVPEPPLGRYPRELVAGLAEFQGDGCPARTGSGPVTAEDDGERGGPSVGRRCQVQPAHRPVPRSERSPTIGRPEKVATDPVGPLELDAGNRVEQDRIDHVQVRVRHLVRKQPMRFELLRLHRWSVSLPTVGARGAKVDVELGVGAGQELAGLLSAPAPGPSVGRPAPGPPVARPRLEGSAADRYAGGVLGRSHDVGHPAGSQPVAQRVGCRVEHATARGFDSGSRPPQRERDSRDRHEEPGCDLQPRPAAPPRPSTAACHRRGGPGPHDGSPRTARAQQSDLGSSSSVRPL
jgi:hypothetical protein